MSSTTTPIIGNPPIVVNNPNALKYIICQLFTEALLVLTLVLLIPSILWEEVRHVQKNRIRKQKIKKQKADAINNRAGADMQRENKLRQEMKLREEKARRLQSSEKAS